MQHVSQLAFSTARDAPLHGKLRLFLLVEALDGNSPARVVAPLNSMGAPLKVGPNFSKPKGAPCSLKDKSCNTQYSRLLNEVS